MTPIPASHADHDPLAVAAHAAGDATGSELDDALALVAACPDCAALHHDLRSIAAALPDLPAPVRTRDFRLTPEQAASIRPAGWRRLLAPLAGPRFAFAGPLGTGLATLGIVGILAAGAVGMPLAGTAAAPGDAAAGTAAGSRNGGADERPEASPAAPQEMKALEDASMAPALVPPEPGRLTAPVASGAPVDEQPGDRITAAGASDAPGGVGATQSGTDPSLVAGAAGNEPAAGTPPAVPVDAGTVPVLPLVSGLALVAGLLLAGLRFAGRHLAR
jgi:hypothetical protein